MRNKRLGVARGWQQGSLHPTIIAEAHPSYQGAVTIAALPDEAPGELLEAWAVMLAAGAAATRRRFGEEFGAEADYIALGQLHARLQIGDPLQACRQCERQAAELLAPAWPAVEAVAAQLVTHRQLTGREVRCLVCRVLRRPQGKRRH